MASPGASQRAADTTGIVLEWLAASEPALAPAARLTITIVGNNVQISWPASATDEGFSLRQAFNLDAPVNWLPIDAGVERVGDRDVVSLPASVGNAFFQLVK